MTAEMAMPASIGLLRLRLGDVGSIRIRDIAAASPALRGLSPRLGRSIRARRRMLVTEMEGARSRCELAAHLSRGLVAYLTREYQYLHLDTGRQSEITRLYSQLLDEFHLGLLEDTHDQAAAAESAAAVSRHHDRLCLLVRDTLDEAGALGRVLDEPDTPVCATYSPAVQLQVLGLDPGRLAGPVLDLGCGPDGGLVSHLRGMGRRDVYGIDQNATVSDGIFRGSWFEAPLARGAWGTVIAHQSFSLHFTHAHLRSEAQAKAYAQTYMRILESLKPGGWFAYAPGLPFLEPLLPDSKWLVRTRPLSRLGPSLPKHLNSTVVTRKA